jgi:hypothetical protein
MTTTLVPSEHEQLISRSDPADQAFPFPPPGYAIAALPDGRFLPMSLLLLSCENAAEVSYSLCGLRWQHEIIPPAEGDWPCTGSILCQTYTDAHNVCERCAETPRLLLDTEQLAVRAECYPDRNVWYRDEIEHLLREAGYCRQESNDGPFSITPMTGGISAWIHARTPTSAEIHLHVQAANLDEMWEAFYQGVFVACGHVTY